MNISLTFLCEKNVYFEKTLSAFDTMFSTYTGMFQDLCLENIFFLRNQILKLSGCSFREKEFLCESHFSGTYENYWTMENTQLN